MADALKRYAGPVALGTSASTLFTVSPGTTATIILIHLCNETASDETVTLSIGTDGAGKRLFKDYTVPANDVRQITGNYPMSAAEIMQGFASAGSAITITIGGIETS